MKKLFISGIGTEVGKTVIASIFTEAMEADYWKPVQSGELDFSDTMKVQSYISNTKSVFHPEVYALNNPLSPHTSADIDGVQIELNQFKLPQTTNNLVVEGAGGLLVPLNTAKQTTLLDLMQQLNLPVILVSRNYLGSINHTLMSYELLKSRNIPIAGLVFNGPTNESGEAFIENYTQLPVILRVDELTEVNAESIKTVAATLKQRLKQLNLL